MIETTSVTDRELVLSKALESIYSNISLSILQDAECWKIISSAEFQQLIYRLRVTFPKADYSFRSGISFRDNLGNNEIRIKFEGTDQIIIRMWVGSTSNPRITKITTYSNLVYNLDRIIQIYTLWEEIR